MRNLLRADLSRFVRRKKMYIFFVLVVVYGLINALYMMVKMMDTSYNYVMGMAYGVEGLAVVFSYLIFFTAYTEDYKSMTLITVIGKGYPRMKVVLSKLLDVVIVSVAVTLIYGCITAGVGLAIGQRPLPDEVTYYVVYSLFNVFFMVGMVTFASIGIYATGSTAFSFLVLTVVLFTNDQLSGLISITPIIKSLHLERILFMNVLRDGFSDVMLGNAAKGLGIMCAGLAVYVGLSLVAIYLIFDKKELDF